MVNTPGVGIAYIALNLDPIEAVVATRIALNLVSIATVIIDGGRV